MHKSQLGGFIIDCQTEDLAAAGAFWSAALGIRPRPAAADDDSPESSAESAYVALDTPAEGIHLEVQRVTHPSRIHLDIETDDLEAEVARLEALGARQIAAVRTWVVMEAPTGQRFCVVMAERANFEQTANRWD